MKKRGMSHIEIVLSFILFVTTVGFALYFFSPLNSSRLIESSLDYSFREISKNVTVGLETFSVMINNQTISEAENSASSPSINPLEIMIPDVEPGWESRVRVYNGGYLDSRRMGDSVHILSPYGWGNINLIIVEFNEEFSPDTVNPGQYHDSYFEISSSNFREVVSEKRFLDLNESYYADYIELKKSFNLPSRVNFGFSLVFNNGDLISAQREIPSSLEVFSESRRLYVLRKDGELSYADIVVWVW